MVLNELGTKLTQALSQVTNSKVTTDLVLNEAIDSICKALLAADVNVHQVKMVEQALKKELSAMPDQQNKRRQIPQIVAKELLKILDPLGSDVENNNDVPSVHNNNTHSSESANHGQFTTKHARWEPTRGKTNVIMFVGLQGAGKTTTCMKYANYYKKAGWKVAMICADTFRAGAYDQLKQNAIRIGVPYYGSYTETDPARVAEEGVAKFRDHKFEIVIVDTSGRHKQQSELFAEMQQVAHCVLPDHVIFVMDGAMGQAAHAQAQAFQSTVSIGSVIVTKLDGHAKGGGALSAVALTRTRIAFIGTGEHMNDFERFSAPSFVKRLLGMGDIEGLLTVITDQNILAKQKETKLLQKLTSGKGQFTFRDLYEQMPIMASMGNFSNLAKAIPGLKLPEGMNMNDTQKKFEMYKCIMNSMHASELDGDPKVFQQSPNRIERLARGAGVSVEAVQNLLVAFKTFQPMMQGLIQGGVGGLFSGLNPGGVLASKGGHGNKKGKKSKNKTMSTSKNSPNLMNPTMMNLMKSMTHPVASSLASSSSQTSTSASSAPLSSELLQNDRGGSLAQMAATILGGASQVGGLSNPKTNSKIKAVPAPASAPAFDINALLGQMGGLSNLGSLAQSFGLGQLPNVMGSNGFGVGGSKITKTKLRPLPKK